MHKLISIASLSALSLTLAGCGNAAEESDDPVETVADEVTLPEIPVTDEPMDDAGDTTGDAADDTGTDGAEAEPTPVAATGPTPVASPSRAAAPAATPTPRPTPTQVAAAAATPPPMFAICSACHAVEPGKNGIGPSLAGVFGAKAGHAAGFGYSDAMLASGLTWDQATLDRYLADPRKVVPGTSMAYAGMKNDAQRKAVIDYLKTL